MKLLSEQAIYKKEWHPTKNVLDATKTGASSKQKAWWLCERGHAWEAVIGNRVDNHSGCPYCTNKQAWPGFNDLATVFPNVAQEWDDVKNGFSADQVLPYSNRDYWWICPLGHSYEQRALSRTAGKQGCSICAGKQALAGFNDLASQRPNIMAEWDYEKNIIDPTKITVGSAKKAFWVCKDGHKWSAIITSRTDVKSPRGCAVCAGRRVVSGMNSLADTHPELLEEWDYEQNTMDPTSIRFGSNILVAWKCTKNGHNWWAKVAERAGTHKTGCPVCTNQSIITGVNDLVTTHPDIAKSWDAEKNKLIFASQVGAGSSKAYWWLCDKNHSWESTVSHRTLSNSGCPRCSKNSSRREQEIVELLKERLGENKVLANKKNIIPPLELDIYIPEHKLAIEYNGVYWHSEKAGKAQWYHYEKWAKCKQQGIQLIQIWEDDYIRDPEKVHGMLFAKLGLSDQPRVAARKCYVDDVSYGEAKSFLTENHIQEDANGSYYLGLKEKASGKLVAVLVLKKEAGTAGKTLNIIRYATSAIVAGGFTKLLTYAELKYKPTKFVTFSDHTVSDGGLYANNGFVADKEIKPDYMYVVNGERKHKFGYRLKRFRDDPALQYQEGLSERELAALNNIPRIWDAGKTRWVKQGIQN